MFVANSVDFNAFYAQGKLSNFFALSPQETHKALALSRTMNRDHLADALERYAKKLNAPKAVFAQLDKLRHKDSRAVVTGQQTGWLLGPSYTLSKAITAINLAASLSTDEKPVVPIFWIASQDHDTDEIDHAFLLDFDETLHYLDVPLSKETPAARIKLESSWITELKETLKAANYNDVFRKQVFELIDESAAVSASFADFFSALVFRLLGEFGLIIVDPMQPDIAELFAPIIKQELDDPTVSSAAINQAGAALKEMGFQPQLGRAEDATNLFLETNGKRELLRFDGQMFFNEAGNFTKQELFEKLELDPTCITPAAGFRPITQDFILPTAVTVGGPGELKYIAQLKGVFEHHGVDMPIIWSRATATLIEPPVSRILQKFDLSLAGVSSFENLRNEKLLELHGHSDKFRDTAKQLEKALESLVTDIKQIDPTLEGTLLKGEAHLSKTLEIMRTKAGKALANRDDTYMKQFDRLEKHLFPNGTPQERLVSPLSFFLKFGIEPVIKAFLAMPAEGNHEIHI